MQIVRFECPYLSLHGDIYFLLLPNQFEILVLIASFRQFSPYRDSTLAESSVEGSTDSQNAWKANTMPNKQRATE